jgi:hypothetical protein
VLLPPGYADGLEGRERVLRSGVFEVEIEKAEPPWQRELVHDALANLLPAASPRARSSSRYTGKQGEDIGLYDARRAVDGRRGTAWVAAAGERASLLEIDLTPPVRANRLLVSHAMSRPYRPAYFGRAVEIEVTINGKETHRLRMPYEETRKGSLLLPQAVFVRRLELRVRLKVPGDVVEGFGLSEVELQLNE